MTYAEVILEVHSIQCSEVGSDCDGMQGQCKDLMNVHSYMSAALTSMVWELSLAL